MILPAKHSSLGCHPQAKTPTRQNDYTTYKKNCNRGEQAKGL